MVRAESAPQPVSTRARRRFRGDGEQLQLEDVPDQGAVAHAAIAVPALEDREGALDRRPDRPDGPIARMAGGIDWPLPVVARHDAVGDPAAGQLSAIPPAVVAAIRVYRPLIALDEIQKPRLVRDVAGREHGPATKPEP